MINVNQITSQLRMLPDQALQRVAMMYKQDPYILPLVVSESMARKQLRMASQARTVAPQPKVNEQAVASLGYTPEEVGIAGLAAPNMERMADGGIAGYDDGGGGMMSPGMLDFAQKSEPVVRMAEGGSKVTDAFERAVNFVLNIEGEQYVADDAGKGPSKFGILQSANKGVNVKDLTKDQAKEIYRKNYWNAIDGDELAKRDPRLALVAFDTAVNHGQDTAKKLLTQADNNPDKVLQLRNDFYTNLIQKDPKRYDQYSKGWTNRLGRLSSEIGSEAEAPKVGSLTSTDLAKARVGAIPGSELRVGDRRYTYEGTLIPEARERTFGEKAIGAGETALSFLSAIPATFFGTGISLGRSALRGEAPTEKQFAEDIGMLTYGPKTEAGQDMTEASAKGIASVLPAYIPAATAPSRAVAAARAARQAEQAAIEAAAARARVAAPGLPPPGMARMTPQQIEAATSKVKSPRLPAPGSMPEVETPRLSAPGATPEQQQASLATLNQDRAAAAAALAARQAEQEKAGLAALAADRAAAAAARRNPTEVATAEANAARLARQQAADVLAAEGAMGRAGTAAEEAARLGVQAGRLAEEGQYATDVARRAGRVGAGAAATQAGTADKKPIVPETPPAAVVPNDLTDKEKDKVVDAAKAAVKDPSKAEGWTNDDWLNFGFAMLANRSPYFMEAVGMAGLKTLAAKQEKAKLLDEKELREAQKEKLRAEAAYIGDTKAKSALYNRAVQMAKAEMAMLSKSTGFMTMSRDEIEEQTSAITRRIYNNLLKQEGFAPEAAVSAPATGNRPPLSSFQK